MAAGDHYRVKAAEFHAQAQGERAIPCPVAEQADCNTLQDVAYEPPPPKPDEKH